MILEAYIFNMRQQRRRFIIFIASLFLICFIAFKYVWNLPHLTDSVRTSQGPHDITIVTMYLNIGGFLKHRGTNYFSPATYKNWMKTWGWLSNRVIAFFDNDEDLEIFRQIRSSQPGDRTVLIKVDRKELPAFKNLEKIRTIYQNESYPKQTPSTVFAEYSCAMNAKYDVLSMAIQRGLVHTHYIAWMDIGMFRNFLEPKNRPQDDSFTLEVPDDFNSSCVGVSAVRSRTEVSHLSAWEYIEKEVTWVAGGFVLATKEVMLKFIQAYTLTVNELINKGMSSTDQTVIGAMYSPEYIKRQPVNIMDYMCYEGQFGLYETDRMYFCLGYICKVAAEKRLETSRTKQMNNLNKRH